MDIRKLIVNGKLSRYFNGKRVRTIDDEVVVSGLPGYVYFVTSDGKQFLDSSSKAFTVITNVNYLVDRTNDGDMMVTTAGSVLRTPRV